MNDPPDGDVLSLNAASLTLTAECNHVLYKPCIVININKPHLETQASSVGQPAKLFSFRINLNKANWYQIIKPCANVARTRYRYQFTNCYQRLYK